MTVSPMATRQTAGAKAHPSNHCSNDCVVDKTLYLGGDVSKGYINIFCMDASRRMLFNGQFDDTPEGHQRLRSIIEKLHHPSRPPSTEQQRDDASQPTLKIGVEASGGLQRNWLQLFHSLGSSCRVYELNPLVVKLYLERDLHRNVTDCSSAKGIAHYLLSGMRAADIPRPGASVSTRGRSRPEIRA